MQIKIKYNKNGLMVNDFKKVWIYVIIEYIIK